MAAVDLILKTVVKGGSKAANELGKSKKSMDDLAVSAVKAGAAIALALGVKAIKIAGDFEHEMAKVATLLDKDMLPSLGRMGDEIKTLATTSTISLNDLAEGMFFVVSAGIDASDQMEFLESATRLAEAGSTDLDTSIRAVVGTMKAYGDESKSAAEVADLLFMINKKGFTTFEEIATSIGKATTFANLAKVSQEELAASMATLVGTTGTASEVSTQLNAVFKSFVKTSGQMDTALQNIGFESGALAIETLGLQGALDELFISVGQDEQAFADLFTEAEAIKAVMPLVGAQAEVFAENLNEASNSMGSTAAAAEIMNSTFNSQTNILKNQLSVAFADLGERVLPIVNNQLIKINESLRASRNLTEQLNANVRGSQTEMENLGVAINATSGVQQEFFQKLADAQELALQSDALMVAGFESKAQELHEQWQGKIADIQDWKGQHAEQLEGATLDSGFFVETQATLGIEEFNNRVTMLNNMRIKDTAVRNAILSSGEAITKESVSAIIAEVKREQSERAGIDESIKNTTLAAMEATKTQTLSKFGSMISGLIAKWNASQGNFKTLSLTMRVVSQAVGGAATGGFVTPTGIKYFQGGGFTPRGTDTVPAMLTPGEVILNAAQQKNVAGQLGNVEINISGVFGSDAAEEIGNLIVERLKHTVAI